MAKISPHLGMVSILTAGINISLIILKGSKSRLGSNSTYGGVNPLEVTHFKSGFLGVPPNFEEKLVYSNGAIKQLRYQWLRFKAMTESSGYFNSSLWDTISGEYFRSFKKKKDYFHIFDYWKWDELTVESTLAKYDWEKAIDTNSSWRMVTEQRLFTIISTIQSPDLQSMILSEVTKSAKER